MNKDETDQLKSAINASTDENLAKCAQNGDKEAEEILLKRYSRYVKGKARFFYLAGGDWEDVAQEGMIGLFKAIRDYKEKSGIPFKKFADLCVRRQITSAVRSANCLKHSPLNTYISLSRPVDNPEECIVLEDILADSIADPEEVYLSEEKTKLMWDTLENVLSQTEGKVLRKYLEGFSYAEIAKDLGKPTKSVDNALQRIKKKLFLYYNEHF